MVLELTDVVSSYGPVRALDGVSLSVPKGSILAVLGANGAGKTSLLRTISGLLRPDQGGVRVEGREITALPVEEIVRLGVSHVPEGRGVIADLTVEENLRLGALWRRKRGRSAQALQGTYKLFPALAERRALSANALSGGERQMLSIARALMGRPNLLLLDEPSLGLAPRVAADIMRQVARLRDHMQLTVLLVEQNARAALAVADYGVVLNLGSVAVAGEPRKLAEDQQLRHAYLGF
jgi:branched-chain amino acid transport system ATP-binding protein